MEKCPAKKSPASSTWASGKRTAIYMPFPQAVPNMPVIDKDNCIY